MDLMSYWYIIRHALNPFRILMAWFMEKFLQKNKEESEPVAVLPSVEPAIPTKIEAPKEKDNFGSLLETCVLNRPSAFIAEYTVRLIYSSQAIIVHRSKGKWMNSGGNEVPARVCNDADNALFEFEKSHLEYVQTNVCRDWWYNQALTSRPVDPHYRDRAYTNDLKGNKRAISNVS